MNIFSFSSIKFGFLYDTESAKYIHTTKIHNYENYELMFNIIIPYQHWLRANRLLQHSQHISSSILLPPMPKDASPVLVNGVL